MALVIRSSASLATSCIPSSRVMRDTTCVYALRAACIALFSDISSLTAATTRRKAGAALEVAMKRSIPLPSRRWGIRRRISSVSLRPVICSSSRTALLTPAVTSPNGASAVVAAVERAMKRYSPPSTSNSTARVWSDPISTASTEPTVATVGSPSGSLSTTCAIVCDLLISEPGLHECYQEVQALYKRGIEGRGEGAENRAEGNHQNPPPDHGHGLDGRCALPIGARPESEIG